MATVSPLVRGSRSNLEVVRKLWAQYESGGPCAAYEWLIANSHPQVEVRMQIAGMPPVVVRGHDELRSHLPNSPLGILGAKAYSLSEDHDDVLASSWVRVGDHGGYMDAQVSWRFEFRDGLLAGIRTLPFAPR